MMLQLLRPLHQSHIFRSYGAAEVDTHDTDRRPEQQERGYPKTLKKAEEQFNSLPTDTQIAQIVQPDDENHKHSRKSPLLSYECFKQHPQQR